MNRYFSKYHFVLMGFAILLNALIFVLTEQLTTTPRLATIESYIACLLLVNISMLLQLKTKTKMRIKMTPIFTLFLLDISLVLYGIYLRTLLKKEGRLDADQVLTMIIGIIAISLLCTNHLTLLKRKKRY